MSTSIRVHGLRVGFAVSVWRALRNSNLFPTGLLLFLGPRLSGRRTDPGEHRDRVPDRTRAPPSLCGHYYCLWRDLIPPSVTQSQTNSLLFHSLCTSGLRDLILSAEPLPPVGFRCVFNPQVPNGSAGVSTPPGVPEWVPGHPTETSKLPHVPCIHRRGP